MSKSLSQPGTTNFSVGNARTNFNLDVTGSINNTTTIYVGNTNFYTAPTGASASNVMVIFGSGSTNNTSDTLIIRQNTNTNPSELILGYNATGGYGYIESEQQGIAFTDIQVCPGGGSLQCINGVKIPKGDGTSNLQNFKVYELNTSGTWTATGALTGTYAVNYTKIGNQAFINFSDITGTAATASTINFITNSIPVRFQPLKIYRQICYGNNNNGGLSSCSVTVSLDGSIVLANTNGTVFTTGQFCGIYSTQLQYTTAT